MRILVACEHSGRVRDAFRERGHDAYSCDLMPGEPESVYHLQGDVSERLMDGWELMIAHPPCTYLANCGLHWNGKVVGRQQQTEDALAFVRRLLEAPIRHIAIENPSGCISTRIRRPDQTIHPWQFGHPESKTTCLWLKNLPKLRPTHWLAPERRQANGRPQWENQTPSGQNKIGPSADRWKQRSLTYVGIANAMAAQWSDLSEWVDYTKEQGLLWRY